MAPIEDTKEEDGRVDRPVSHIGLGDTLPPLRPCQDARTPAEACSLPTAETRQPLQGDILERLKEITQAESSSSSSSQRHWGPAEITAKDCLEAFGNSSGVDRLDAHSSILESLNDATASAVDDSGFTLLHYASMYGSVDAVAALVRKRANVNARTQVHETPLQLAAYYRHPEVCAVLLTHRARIDLADWQGRTPLTAAMESKCGNGPDNTSQAQAQCVELLKEKLEKEKEGVGVKEAEDLRKQGNQFFKKGELKEAIAAYSVGLAHWDDSLTYSNRSECYLKLERFIEAKLDAKKSLGLAGEDGSKKAAWRLGKACLALGELDNAEDAAKRGLSKNPSDAALKQLRVDIERERRHRLGQT